MTAKSEVPAPAKKGPRAPQAPRKVRFRQSDVARALRAAKEAGMAIARFEIDADGKIVVVSAQAEPTGVVDELVAWRAKRHARGP